VGTAHHGKAVGGAHPTVEGPMIWSRGSSTWPSS